MKTTVEGSNSADKFSPLDGGAGILLLGLDWVVRLAYQLTFCIFSFSFSFFSLNRVGFLVMIFHHITTSCQQPSLQIFNNHACTNHI